MASEDKRRREAGAWDSGGGIGLPRYYTTDEVAGRFRRHPRTIRDWIRHGCPTQGRLVKLPAVRLGSQWQVREDWLVMFEHQVRPAIGRPDLDVE